MTEINNIEEVAKKLCSFDNYLWEGLPDKATNLFTGANKNRYRRRAKEICQLFPQPLTDEALKKKVKKILEYHGVFDVEEEIVALLQQRVEEAKGEGLKELRARITTLEKKLDDREADLINAQKKERERIQSAYEGEWYGVTDTYCPQGIVDIRQALKKGESE